MLQEQHDQRGKGWRKRCKRFSVDEERGSLLGWENSKSKTLGRKEGRNIEETQLLPESSWARFSVCPANAKGRASCPANRSDRTPGPLKSQQIWPLRSPRLLFIDLL